MLEIRNFGMFSFLYFSRNKRIYSSYVLGIAWISASREIF